ncbi:MAG: zf-HC2 domain-containing protein [Acidobacteriota bacterium]
MIKLQTLKLRVAARLEDVFLRRWLRWRGRSIKGERVKEECASLEAIAAFVDHALPPREQAQLETHMIYCARCRQILVMVFRSKQAVPDPDPFEAESR